MFLGFDRSGSCRTVGLCLALHTRFVLTAGGFLRHDLLLDWKPIIYTREYSGSSIHHVTGTVGARRQRQTNFLSQSVAAAHSIKGQIGLFALMPKKKKRFPISVLRRT